MDHVLDAVPSSLLHLPKAEIGPPMGELYERNF